MKLILSIVGALFGAGANKASAVGVNTGWLAVAGIGAWAVKHWEQPVQFSATWGAVFIVALVVYAIWSLAVTLAGRAVPPAPRTYVDAKEPMPWEK